MEVILVGSHSFFLSELQSICSIQSLFSSLKNHLFIPHDAVVKSRGGDMVKGYD